MKIKSGVKFWFYENEGYKEAERECKVHDFEFSLAFKILHF